MNEVHLGGFDLNLLVALDALLAERSVTRAAARIGITQSAASHALSRLRKLTGDELLVRGRDGMVPTIRAEDMRAPLRRALEEITGTLSSSGAFDPKPRECAPSSAPPTMRSWFSYPASWPDWYARHRRRNCAS
jgi:DNA-binding transcriptional LysR family regulator